MWRGHTNKAGMKLLQRGKKESFSTLMGGMTISDDLIACVGCKSKRNFLMEKLIKYGDCLWKQ